MMARVWRYGISVVAVFTLLMSCAAKKPLLSSEWRDEGYAGGTITKILVIGASEKPAIRQSYEDRFVRQLEKQGRDAVASYRHIPADKMLDREAVESAVKNLEVDAVLVTKLLYKETIQRERPEEKAYQKSPSYYADFSSFLLSESISPASSGDPNRNVHLETNLYDVPLGKKVWSARTELFVQGSPDKEIDAFIEVLMNRLSEEKLLR